MAKPGNHIAAPVHRPDAPPRPAERAAFMAACLAPPLKGATPEQMEAFAKEIRDRYAAMLARCAASATCAPAPTVQPEFIFTPLFQRRRAFRPA